ncbi:protein sprouty homolog 2 [Esox lucius]|uniref:Protein sprouty homolog 2 n=1 Tax=Esox lucius TaxID=8010 RepID=A0A3P8YYZ6_ESOLU|nr:protein sprouty homolog 2 [Esox lucius]
MENGTQNASSSDGGGGGSSGVLRPHCAQEGQPDPGVNPGPQAPVLSLDQIRITGSSNEYTEGPTVGVLVAPRPPGSSPAQQKNDSIVPPGPGRTNVQPEATRPDQRGPLAQHPQPTHSAPPATDAPCPSPGAEGSRSSPRTSTGSASSAQRLLSSPAGGKRTIRSQPKQAALKPEELKPLASAGAAPACGEGLFDKHACRCKDCGRCKCRECAFPRILPSCWMCGQRCICSAQNAVDYGTCVCCVKGLFYHCSSDKEDTCTDKPFSCGQSHCCVRWTVIGLLSLFLPCFLCYLPAKGCLAACQSCYDRVKRPGCRCTDANVVHRKGVYSKPT